MFPVLKWLRSFFGLKSRKKNGTAPPITQLMEENHKIDDSVLRVIADLGGPKRSTDSRGKRGHRVFDRR